MLILSLGLAACGSAATPQPTAVSAPTSPGSTANVVKFRVTDYPPASYKGADGQWTGLDVEIAKAVVEKAGYTIEFTELPFARGIKEMEDGTIQMMANLSKTDERSKFLTWIGPERTTKMGLVVKAGNEQLPIKTLDDLVTACTEKKARFGIQSDVFYSKEFNDRLSDPKFSDCFEKVAESELNTDKLQKDRILGFFEETNNMRYQIATNARYKGLALHDFILNSEDVYIGVSLKGATPEMAAKLQAAFDALQKDGTLDKIRNQEWK
jgi:ABC-type amino acid transport substrate-binding protein